MKSQNRYEQCCRCRIATTSHWINIEGSSGFLSEPVSSSLWENNSNKTVVVWQGFVGIKENDSCVKQSAWNNSSNWIHLLVSSKEVSERIHKFKIYSLYLATIIHYKSE